MWRLKGGTEAYAYFLRRYTTTNLTPDQIHQIGLDEVARIEKEMDTIFRKLGRTEGSINDRSQKLKQDLAYPRTEAGRAAIMADADSILRDAEKRAALLFDKTPKARVVVRSPSRAFVGQRHRFVRIPPLLHRHHSPDGYKINHGESSDS